MKTFSQKIFLTLVPPSEEHPQSIDQILRAALADLGFLNLTIPLRILQMLYTICLTADYQFTVTLVFHQSGWMVTNIEAGNTSHIHYALAVDYGSTTIIMQLIDMNKKEIVATAKESNRQSFYGADILSRITYTMGDPSHQENLQHVTVDTFHRLFQRLSAESGMNVRTCPVMIVSGNTTMIHFLLKLDARTVFFAPYAPVTKDPGWVWGKDLGMKFDGLLYFIPAASNYVGGDIVSGLLNLDLYKKEEIHMFFDIGTNGELVIGNRDWLIAGAGAAGPALEGYISRFGTAAESGAIDTVHIHGKSLLYTTIDNHAPKGICGSGIIDLIAQMRLHGWINIAGELNPSASSHIMFHPEENQYVVKYAGADVSQYDEDLYFSQTDIYQYLDTKAAAFTMIDSLLGICGCTEKDIDHCYLSGAFSAHSDLESAITIGIFPDLPRRKFSCIENASLDGARTLLLDVSKIEEIIYITSNIHCVQFASIPDFLVRMQAAKFIPHTDMERFPIVQKHLSK